MSDLRKQLAEKSKKAREENERLAKEFRENAAKREQEARKKRYAQLHNQFVKDANEAAARGEHSVDVHRVPRDEMKLRFAAFDNYYEPVGESLEIAKYFRDMGFRVELRTAVGYEDDDYGSSQSYHYSVLRVYWED